MIEIEGPDGVIYEFPAGTDDATIKTAMGKVYGAPQAAPQAQAAPTPEAAQPQERGFWQRVGDNVIGFDDGVTSPGEKLGTWLGQRLDGPSIGDASKAAGAGVARGAAGLADLPGAAFGAGATAGSWAAERLGLASPEQSAAAQSLVRGMGEPVIGGGSSFRDAASDLTGGATEYRGQTTLGQYAGTVGEFLPGAVGGGGGILANLLKFGVVPGIASEGAGQLTEGTAAEPVARALAPLLAAVAGAKLTQPKAPTAPTRQALADQAEGLYRAGDQRPAAPPQAIDDLKKAIDGQLRDMSRITPAGRTITPAGVDDFMKVLDDYRGQPIRPEEMQNLRSFLQDAAGSAEARDRRVGRALLEKFDDWRNQHVPEYAEADQLYQRLKKSDDIDWRVQKAENRAASSGTGGNAVNAARQNIRQILDDPKKLRGYSPDEISAMKDFVKGTPSINAMRLLGRLSPNSGAFPMAGAIGTGIAGSMTANPLLLAPSVAGWLAKGGAEMATSRSLGVLSELIRNGAPLPARQPSNVSQGLLAALAGINAGRE